MWFFNTNPPATRKGDTIRYAVYGDPQDVRSGKVTGHGWHKGRRIIEINDNTWCYRSDVVEVLERARKNPKAGL